MTRWSRTVTSPPPWLSWGPGLLTHHSSFITSDPCSSPPSLPSLLLTLMNSWIFWTFWNLTNFMGISSPVSTWTVTSPLQSPQTSPMIHHHHHTISTIPSPPHHHHHHTPPTPHLVLCKGDLLCGGGPPRSVEVQRVRLVVEDSDSLRTLVLGALEPGEDRREDRVEDRVAHVNKKAILRG